jgi:hypothetical protein
MLRYRFVVLMSECPRINERLGCRHVRQQAACAFVSQVVPVEIDLAKLRALDTSSRLGPLRLVA